MTDNPFDRLPDGSESPEDDLFERIRAEMAQEQYGLGAVGDSEDSPAQSALEALRAQLLDSAGLDNIPDPDPLIGTDTLFRDSLNWLIGKPGSGKSFVALDIAGCVGTGLPWQGHKVSQGPVLYLVAEGVRGVKKRVRAWEQSMATRMSGVYFLPVAVQAKNALQWQALIELARELKPILIIIDTQARATVGVEENSNMEMGEVVDQFERLRWANGACVIVVHHIGRAGDTGRGATALDGALSTIVKCTKDDLDVTLECTKNKDGEQWAPLWLRLIPTGESLVPMVAHGEARFTKRKWLQEWWSQHETEPVSVSTLIDTGVVSKSQFHRDKLGLINTGLVVRTGTGHTTRYALTGNPSQE